MAKILFDIGRVHFELGNLTQALTYAERANRIDTRCHNVLDVARDVNLKGVVCVALARSTICVDGGSDILSSPCADSVETR